MVLAFSLLWAPATFTKIVRQLTHGLNDAISYLNDMLVFHQTLSGYLIGVRRLLDRIRQFGLTIRPTKTYVATIEVIFLGHTIGQSGIMLEPS